MKGASGWTLNGILASALPPPSPMPRLNVAGRRLLKALKL